MTIIYDFIEFFFHITFIMWKDLELKLVLFTFYFLTMTEIYLSLPSSSEENNDIDDFFDNIPENEDDFTSLFAEISSINKAKELLVSNSDSTNDDDSENTNCETSSMSTIAGESTEAEDEIEIPQISTSNLTPCALIDTVNGSIQWCGETKDLRGLAQLIGTWQIDSNAICEAGSNLENLGVCFSHFAFDQNRLHKKNAKKNKILNFVFYIEGIFYFVNLILIFLVVENFVMNIQFFLKIKSYLHHVLDINHVTRYKLMNQLLLLLNYNKNHSIYV